MTRSSERLSTSQSSSLAPDQGLYPISVVTELTGVEPHTLRGYERAGLLLPARTEGGSRRYSDNDLARLRRIALLVGDRVNFPGIRRILELEHEVYALQTEIARLQAQLEPTTGSAPDPIG